MPLNASSPNIIRTNPIGGFTHVCDFTPEDAFNIVWAYSLRDAVKHAEKHPELKDGVVRYIATVCGTGLS